MAIVEQPKPIDKERIHRYLGKINKEQMKALETAMLIEFGIEGQICVEAP